MEKTAKKICSILVRLLASYSLDLSCLMFLDFLFAIAQLIPSCLCTASAIAFSSSSIVTGFMT